MYFPCCMLSYLSIYIYIYIFLSLSLHICLYWQNGELTTMQPMLSDLHLFLPRPKLKLMFCHYFATHCTFGLLSDIGNMRIPIWPAAFQSMSHHISRHTRHMLYQNTLKSPWHSSTQNQPRPWHKPPFTHTPLYTLWHPSKNTSLLTRNTLVHSSTDTS